MEKIVNKLIDNNITIAVAESFTGGMFSAAITSVPDSSIVFNGSIVSYSIKSKIEQLGVRGTTIGRHGSISKETSIEMAVQAMTKFETDMGVSFTGNAGPNSSDNHPVGYGFITIIYGDNIVTKELNLKGTRIKIREQAIKIAFDEIEKLI